MGEWSSKETGAERRLEGIPRSTTVYAVFGDSLSEGMGYRKVKESLPAGMRGYHVYSVIGEQSSATVARVKAAKVPKGSTIMVFTGTNDLKRVGWGILSSSARIQARLRENVQELMDWAAKKDVRLVLVAVPPCKEYRALRNAKLAMPDATLRAMEDYNRWLLGRRSEKVTVLDLSPLAVRGEWGLGMRPRLTTDGLHPNNAGYVTVAGMLEKELGRAGRQETPAAVALQKRKLAH